ncbi:MAG TPA: hypothetical protein VFQ35_21180, partial [Polyangiaceae bacterium]|nr:hypothetical protein [Polyangiaceae bacterium]
MTRVELHPEELLERARKEIASPEELVELRAHLAACRACALEHAFSADGDRASAPRADDDAVLARVRERTLRALAARTPRSAVRRVSRRLSILAAAALVLLIATYAVGSRLVGYLGLQRSEPPASSRSADSTRNGHVTISHPPDVSSSAPPVASPAPSAAPTEPETAVPQKAQHTAARPARAAPEPVSSSEPSENAGELFARANLARRASNVTEAARLYRELQRAFPGSTEARVSRVTLGRMLLDRLGDASGALLQFDSYLSNPSNRGLREEALIGRALALGRLGRRGEESAA